MVGAAFFLRPRLFRTLVRAGVAAAWTAALACAAGAQAQDRTEPDPDPIIVTGSRPCAEPHAVIDYACLTDRVRSTSRPAPGRPTAFDAITAEADTPSRVGTFSRSATAQRMGSNFGKAATPYRPAAPVYANPLQAPALPR